LEAALDAKRPPLELLDAKMLLRGAVVASDLKISPLEDVPAEKSDVEPLPEVVDETPVLDELLVIPNRLPVDAVAISKAGAAEAVAPNKLPVEATLEPNNEPLEADDASLPLETEATVISEVLSSKGFGSTPYTLQIFQYKVFGSFLFFSISASTPLSFSGLCC
jgi:hypothetical protein